MDDDSYLKLPSEPDRQKQEENPAADLVRKKVEAAYAKEPSARAELKEVEALSARTKHSKHQKFIEELVRSGKSVEETQVAWHDYYASLSDKEKHDVWQEFYANQGMLPRHPTISATIRHKPRPSQEPSKSLSKSFSELVDKVLGPAPKRPPAPRKSPVHSLVFGIGVGAIVIVVLLFSFFNERFIAPFIQPSRSLSNVPLISDAVIGPNPEVIIPKINVEIPVVYDVKTIDDAAIDNALENGVVHYADTALPGQDGNVVIVGHSSNNIFNKGKYKFAFVLLSRLEPGDTFYLQKDGKRYTYEVYQKKIVKANDVSVLGLTDREATATLITCDPPGTSINRLVVTGEQINPDPSSNSSRSSDNNLATHTKVIPGNSKTLWSRLTGWLTH